VDLFKGAAVIWMIETHVTNALVLPALQAGPAFDWLNYLNGLVAPAFLFSSGALFLVTLKRKLPDFLSLGPLFWRQLYRLLGVVALGYVLHLPRFSLRQMVSALNPRDWQEFLQADILQTIGVSLILMVFLTLLLRRRGVVALGAGIIGLGVYFLAPWVVNSGWTLPGWLSPYLTGRPKTMFPLFPWGGFLLMGSGVGYLYDRVKGSSWFVLGITLFGILLFWASWNSNPLAQAWFVAHGLKDFYLSSPSWYLGKLGLMTPGIGIWWAWERWAVPKKVFPLLTRIITLFGRQSLLAYFFHIPIVYGSSLGWGLRGATGGRLTWGQAAWVGLGVMLLTGLVSWAWDAFKSRSSRWSRRAFYLLWALALACFLLSP
jgi:uncharacterized membrane protein